MAKEATYSIHIEFDDGSNLVVYRDRTVAEVTDILKDWCENWELRIDENFLRDGTNKAVLFWHAKKKKGD